MPAPRHVTAPPAQWDRKVLVSNTETDRNLLSIRRFHDLLAPILWTFRLYVEKLDFCSAAAVDNDKKEDFNRFLGQLRFVETSVTSVNALRYNLF